MHPEHSVVYSIRQNVKKLLQEQINKDYSLIHMCEGWINIAESTLILGFPKFWVSNLEN